MISEGRISFKCLPVHQPIGEFYIGVIDAKDLVDISWADIRRIAHDDPELAQAQDYTQEVPRIAEDGAGEVVIEDLDEEILRLEDQGFERFLGIQRQLSATRVKELRRYVNNLDATFPTSVLLAISSDHAAYDETTGIMEVVRHSKAAKIIDGQHRIAGLRNYSRDGFQINVAVFIDMDIQDQAMVFATINLRQTKVNKSLAYDLYEFTTSRSPQRSCHDIVRFLNLKKGSPFHDKIKMLGVAQDPGETITQAMFVDRLLRYISRDPLDDRNRIKSGDKPDRATGAAAQRQIFRNMFIDDQDERITMILWNYFLAVANKWPNAWLGVTEGNILNRSTGFAALMRFLRVAYRSIPKPPQVVVADKFAEVFERVTLSEHDFTREKYLPGSTGEKDLFGDLVTRSGLGTYR